MIPCTRNFQTQQTCRDRDGLDEQLAGAGDEGKGKTARECEGSFQGHGTFYHSVVAMSAQLWTSTKNHCTLDNKIKRPGKNNHKNKKECAMYFAILPVMDFGVVPDLEL